MKVIMSKGSVRWRGSSWSGNVRYKVVADDATPAEQRKVGWRQKSFTLREAEGRRIRRPTEARPNLGHDQAEKSLAEAKERFARDVVEAAQAEQSRLSPKALAERSFLAQYRAGRKFDFRDLTYDQRALLSVHDFLEGMVDLLADGTIQREGRPLAVGTIKAYRTLIPRIDEYLGDKPIGEVGPADIDAFRSDIAMRGSLGERGYSRSRQAAMYKLLKQAYRYAIQWGCVDADPFRFSPPVSNKKPEPNPLTLESLNRMQAELDGMEPSRMKTAFKLALEAGLRLGEVCALQWRDIDCSTGIAVHHVVVRDWHGYIDRPWPKSKASERTVPVARSLARELGAWRDVQRAEFADAGCTLCEADYVLGGPDGGFARPFKVSGWWHTFATMNRLTGTRGKLVNFHGLRHSFITFAVASGADIKAVSAVVGHASAAMTLDTYADALPEAKRQAVDTAEAFMEDSALESGLDAGVDATGAVDLIVAADGSYIESPPTAREEARHGFGFCPECGAAYVKPRQRFCMECGSERPDWPGGVQARDPASGAQSSSG